MLSNLSFVSQLMLRKTLNAVVLLWAALVWPTQGMAQTVLVDATPSHVVNTFSPLYSLGSTVDRVPSNATDMFFRPDQIKQVLSAGWGVVSYRQNTDLFVQAWHWNPKGTWSDPTGKGYFTGDATPTKEMQWHAASKKGHADPDGPPATSQLTGGENAQYNLPAASVTVLRGRLAAFESSGVAQ